MLDTAVIVVISIGCVAAIGGGFKLLRKLIERSREIARKRRVRIQNDKQLRRLALIRKQRAPKWAVRNLLKTET